MPCSGMLRRIALIKTEVSEECIASVIRVIQIGKLETTLAVNNNRSTLQRRTRRRHSSLPTSVRNFRLIVYLSPQLVLVHGGE
jgi:hypothetical protein